jgi:hypothetical protein
MVCWSTAWMAGVTGSVAGVRGWLPKVTSGLGAVAVLIGWRRVYRRQQFLGTGADVGGQGLGLGLELDLVQQPGRQGG